VADRPLHGKRIVVTRPREHAGPLVTALERLGAEAWIVPLIAVAPLEDDGELRRLVESGDHDWIVFTSANAVRTVASVAPQLRARIAAIGPATADAVRALGIEPAFVPGRFAAREIADGLEPLVGARLLLPQSEIAERSFADGLRARGATVDVVDAYRTVGVEPASADLVRLGRADAILLASGSAARSLAAAAISSERTLVVCIGPSTADAARAAGLEVDLVAEDATGEGMIRALVSHFGES
jgi:uroporphyrinogen III methyltransferase / synthase